MAVKPVFGGARTRDGGHLAAQDKPDRGTKWQSKKSMPMLRDLSASGYKSVVSQQNVHQNGILSDFNVTGGFSR